MNASLLSLVPLVFSALIYIVGALKIEGSLRARFRLPLTLEIKVLYLLGVFIPMIIFPKAEGGVVGGYPRILGIEVGIDKVSTVFLLAEFSVFGASSLYLITKATNWKELSLLLTMHSGLIGAFISKDFFNFYVFMELATVSSIGLIALSRDKESRKAAFKYLMLSMVASYLLIVALGMIYFETGYLNVELAASKGVKNTLPIKVAALALIVKAGIFPFHVWLPDAHSKAETHISAILSGISVKAPIYGLLLISTLGDLSFLKAFALSSMVFGVIMAIMQRNAKRLLAYHTVSQMGYVLLAVSNSSIFGAAIYSLAHALFKSGLFLGVGSIVDVRKKKELEFLGCRDRPLLLLVIATLSLAIAGLGVTIGGVAKGMIGKDIIDKVFIYGVSLGTATSFSKLNYYLWRGYGVEPRSSSILPSAIQALLVTLTGLLLGGKPSVSDLLIIGGIAIFFLIKDILPKKDKLLSLEIGDAVAIFSLVLSFVIFFV
ncbi:proton-conducting transporter membrane subunit [Pyrococcus sp. ST04]|uniref:proton-conducting transporter transmembrane domain-containing protein n=1 Tax=Pyrococcus sp. ST04 TaxID=1183377 RepID=UPI0002605FE4|nr:proton-conducting transporter membrane subunit [Pyrococcus sp. ST04]AFK22731.1 putative monovalent cation/H+ antiporter subunit D [Pyrococcus sp. ST04]